MRSLTLVLAFSLLSVSVHPFLIEVPSQVFPKVEALDSVRSVPKDVKEDPWSKMTIIKTHYDCRGYPMWREVSRIKSRAGESVEVVKSSREDLNSDQGNSVTSEAPVFFKSMRSRVRTGAPRPTATATMPATVTPHPRPRPLGDLVEVGPDRIIDTPIISCPQGYNEDYNGRCRPVFPEQ